MRTNPAPNTEEQQDFDKAQDIADRAAVLAEELLALPKDVRRRTVEIFAEKEWTAEDIKGLVGSVSVKLLKKIVSLRLR